MLRLTISVNKPLADSFDRLIESKGYRNRSEAFRDLLRTALKNEVRTPDSTLPCIATVSYLVDICQRAVRDRIATLQQQAQEVSITVTTATVDSVTVLEALILRGSVQAVMKLADAIVAESGVRHGQVNLIPAEPVSETSIEARQLFVIPANHHKGGAALESSDFPTDDAGSRLPPG
jgi:CopG family nickel-responsive transcriptional regulator